MRALLARLALGLAVLVAGWALAEAILGRWSQNAAEQPRVARTDTQTDTHTVPSTDLGPSNKKETSARRPRRSASSSSNPNEFLQAHTPVVIPPGANEIGFEPGTEPPAAENRPATSRVDRETPPPGAPPARAQEPPAPAPGVVPESPVGGPETAEDAAITLEVRRRIEGAAPGRRIQVSTRNRVVTLSGAVDTEQQKADAIEAARQTPGVARVQDHLVVLVS